MGIASSTLKLIIAGDNKGAIKAVAGTEKAVGGLKGQASGLAAGLAGAFSVGSIVAFGKSAVAQYENQAGAVAKIKRLTGESAEGASLLAFRSQQAGINADKAAASFAILSRNIGSGKIAKEGIITKDAQGNLLSFEKILSNIQTRYQSLGSASEKAALAQAAFGRGGADMGKLLAQSRGDIIALTAEMEKYGLKFTESDLKKYKEFVQAQRDLQRALAGVQVTLAKDVIPALTQFYDIASTLGPVVVDVFKTMNGVGGPFFKAFEVGFSNLSNAVDAFKKVTGSSTGEAEVLGAVVDAIVGLTESTDEAAVATGNLTGKTKELASGLEIVNKRTTEAVGKTKELASARDAELSAQADSVRANFELAEARKAAAGNSDEYRDAEKAVAEAVAEIPDAQRAAAEAVDGLADARENAAEKIRDLARAEREAALASADAALRVKEAENEQRRVNADPRSSALQKERAALEVAQAREEARGAKQDANQAAADAAEAQRKGIEGDAEVVKARQSVADANDGVRDAVNRVREAEATAAQVIVDAKAKVLEAQANATEAALNEASAWGDLVTKQYGAVAGAQAYRDKLAEIAADLDPSSPLAQRIARLIADINGAISTGLGQNPSARPPTRNPDAGLPTTDGAGAPIKAPPAGGDSAAPTGSDGGVTVHLEQHNTYQGTPTQQRRANDQQARRTLNGLAWGLR